jgi:hypothetical protein
MASQEQINANRIKYGLEPITNTGRTIDSDIQRYKSAVGIKPVEQKEETKGFIGKTIETAKNIGSALTKSEQYLGQDISRAIIGGDKFVNDLAKKYTDNATKYLELAKKGAKQDPNAKYTFEELAQQQLQEAQKVGQDFKGRTPEQIVGDVLGIGLDIATTVSGLGVAKATIGGTGIVKGAIQGAKTGAIAGATLGGAYGTTGAMQENKNVEGVIEGGIGGAVTGGLTGGALGGISGAVVGGIKGHAGKVLKKEEEFVKDLVSPKATTKVKQQALREGRVTEQGLFKGSKILPSKRDEQTAEVVKDIVSSKNSIIQNLDAVDNKVSEINSGVGAYIEEFKRPFNTNQLKTQLNAGRDDLKLVFASDKTAQKTYEAVVNEFMKHIENKDTKGLFLARQSFDKVPAIKKLLDSRALGENTKKEIVLTVRDMANKYIANLLPEGNQYKLALLNETKMINAIKNMAEKNAGMIGRSKLIQLTEKYPILKWIVGGIATGIVGSAGVGVGSAIIGSTD